MPPPVATRREHRISFSGTLSRRGDRRAELPGEAVQRRALLARGQLGIGAQEAIPVPPGEDVDVYVEDLLPGGDPVRLPDAEAVRSEAALDGARDEHHCLEEP